MTMRGALVCDGMGNASVQTVGDKVQVAKNTMIIALFTVLGLVGALGVDALLVAQLGLSCETDALFVALTVLQLAFVIVSKACRAVLVPAFSRARVERGTESVWQLFGVLVSAALLIFAALASR